jgi:hypothetical protein
MHCALELIREIINNRSPSMNTTIVSSTSNDAQSLFKPNRASGFCAFSCSCKKCISIRNILDISSIYPSVKVITTLRHSAHHRWPFAELGDLDIVFLIDAEAVDPKSPASV